MKERYPLEMLITARKIREDNAQRDVTTAKNALTELLQNIENKSLEIQYYEEWRKEEEIRRFQEIQNTTLTKQEMDKFKWGITALKARAIELEEEKMTMESKIPEMEKKIEEAVLLHKEAISQKEKIEEHKAKWKEELMKEANRLEDLELEEFRAKDLSEYDDEANSEE